MKKKTERKKKPDAYSIYFMPVAQIKLKKSDWRQKLCLITACHQDGNLKGTYLYH